MKKSEAPDYYEVIRFPIGEHAPFRPLTPPNLLLPSLRPTARCPPDGPAPRSLLKARACPLLPQT